MHYKISFLGIYKMVLGSNEPFQGYFFQYKQTLGDPLFLMGGYRSTGGIPAGKRMKRRERGKSEKKKRPVFVGYVCLFVCSGAVYPREFL
jgi:hypothetical protein